MRSFCSAEPTGDPAHSPRNSNLIQNGWAGDRTPRRLLQGTQYGGQVDGREGSKPWSLIDHDRQRDSGRSGCAAGLCLRPDRAALRIPFDLVGDPRGDPVSAPSAPDAAAWKSWIGAADRADWRRVDAGADGDCGDVACDDALFADLDLAEPGRDHATATAMARWHPAWSARN